MLTFRFNETRKTFVVTVQPTGTLDFLRYAINNNYGRRHGEDALWKAAPNGMFTPLTSRVNPALFFFFGIPTGIWVWPDEIRSGVRRPTVKHVAVFPFNHTIRPSSYFCFGGLKYVRPLSVRRITAAQQRVVKISIFSLSLGKQHYGRPPPHYDL